MFNLNQQGQIILLATIFMTLITINVVLLISNAINFNNNSRYSVQGLQATNIAEAALDKAVASLNATVGSYTGEGETFLGPGSYEVTVTTLPASKLITATAYIPNKTNTKIRRTISIQTAKGAGAAFNYGIQVGEGGIVMSNGANVDGSVYSNGNIVMNGNNTISGDTYVAGGTQPSPDQQTDCASVCDFQFGGAGFFSQIDVAQSFKPSVSSQLNKVSLKLKKIGSPNGDLRVDIMRDNGGKPNTSSTLAYTNIYNSLVSSTYSFVTVGFVAPAILTAGTTYWIKIHPDSSCCSSSKRWSWALDGTNPYNLGFGSYNNGTNNLWNSLTTSDFVFQTYMGGVPTKIIGAQPSNTKITGNAYANTLYNIGVGGDAYFQSEGQVLVRGSNCSTNIYCHVVSVDPGPATMPISDAQIAEWKSQTATNPINSIPACSSQITLGPGKYIGNVVFPNNCTIIIKSPLYITGNLTLGNNDIIKLDPSYGLSSGVVMTDGLITINPNVHATGSGTAGSFLMLLSTRDHSLGAAITVDNNFNSNVLDKALLYAGNGTISVANNVKVNEISAWGITLSNNVTISYDTGLASTFFSSGPSGAFSAIKGTYQSK